ncbi:hypothetical protein NSP_22430 [Nodularia spumigena CCY9414]|nr:hypothetical protein NSP_22430 [Nodularia spumigena CCY9414]EAW44659.1 hypothetical protein N9414_06319 [Nodularia spumigena CCY9414]
MKILYWFAVAVGLWFAFLNIQPYAEVVKIATEIGIVKDNALLQLVNTIPIINGLARTIGLAFHWFVGLIVWVTIQTIEVFPVILKRDRVFMKTIIKELQSSEKFAERDGDDPTLIALKRWYNNFPTLTITKARTLSLFVYAVDFLICTVVYPPVNGGFGRLMFILVSGQWNQIIWANVFLLLATLFGVELIIRFLFWLGEIAYYMKAAHSR